MAPIAGFDKIKDLLTPVQQVILLVEHWILFGLYTGLFVLCLVNVWNILVKLGKWKVLPLLCFYVMSTISIGLRVACLLSYELSPTMNLLSDL